MTDELTLLKNRLLELADRAEARGTYTYTGFLSPAEQAALHALGRAISAPYALHGGMADCERQMAVFGSPALCGYAMDPPIACLKIAPVNARFAAPLSHRDYLGALMALGVTREKLGDIVLREDAAYLFCTAAIAPYITENLTSVGRVSVRSEAVDAPPAGPAASVASETVSVSSLRLDALLAACFHLSRAESAALFAAERVFIGGAPVKNGSAAPREGDVVSLRGYGRFRYVGVTGTSKKGRLRVQLDRYV